MYPRNPYSNHKCKIQFDANGIKLKNPIIQEYDMMNSSINKEKQNPNFNYLGYGECVSVYNSDSKCEIKLSGMGHFYTRK